VTLVKVLPFAILMYGTFHVTKRWVNTRGKSYRFVQAFRDAVSKNLGASMG